ncbi:hypothetical protein ABMA28_007573 [Loxostege sticticalis]|uniref:Lipocalin/cytosolic fatty-acid binding domain-containing protein n=1 Tax=Loxostege sticticalis TaxID=481309 RepID=A0ABD0SHZ5_LOXSC
MFKMLVLVISLLGLVHSGVGQIIQTGQCEQLVPNPNFDQATFNRETFSGTWYEFRRTENYYQSGDCSRVELAQTDDGYDLRYPAVNANFFEERNVTVAHENGTASLVLSVPNVEYPINVTVIRTDYSSFAIAYSCRNIDGTQRALTVWELLRQSSYPNAILPALVNTTLMTSFGISVEDMRLIDHSDDACYQLPVIPLGQPVILPGSCNQNIPVAQGFDASRFQGRWFEIGAYYSESSENLCSRANYALEGGVVQVLNSQVINQTLFTISGTATVASTDGSARLSVVLEVGNVNITQDLWVLATDYDNYAVSYSCQDLPNNERRVYSWILSKNRQLTPESQVAVDRVLASDVSLNNAYYRRTDQSDEACFFFPPVNPNGNVIFPGQCDTNIRGIQGFDPFAYEGIWHDIESYPSVFQTGACRNAEYTVDNATGIVDVLNTQVLGTSLATINGQAVLVSEDGSALLNVTFPMASNLLWVLDTDYTSYSLVYSCTNLNDDERFVSLWKLSRTKSLPPAASNAINSYMSNYNIMDQRYFVEVDQSVEGCFFYPEAKPGVPVVFPGQCDPNVEVVQNFNLNLFDGIWYEVEAYPKDQQQGQCVNHQYSQGVGNTLNLQSSQVIDQFLSISNGTLSFNSTDNSARMQIDIIVDGEVITIPFWILDTDYNDYALAYSCVNRGSDFRAIYSWKLSRDRVLSTNAINAINNRMSRVQVLEQRYYEPIDQSLEACFFLPELAPGEPVILVGQCDPNITVVQNFDAGRYLGNWRLIESYPANFQTGTCNQANYEATTTPGVVSVVNTQVINQTLATTTGGQAVASADGTGKLFVTFAGSTQATELWILDTDYESYSIAYSCSNLDSERRRVWSWKLSRTRTLSEPARNAINQVVNSVQVLNNRYYETIDQSDAACFYFPEPDFSVSGVLFRGRCDPNINVVQNFTAGEYLGIWRNIELYPSNFQAGSCNTAQYSAGPNGTVIVRNSQVVNQSLATIDGVAIVTSTDDSAKLMVSFPTPSGNFTETPLYVLATDYRNYALTYTCVQVDDDHRRVWSWKLSRTRELNSAAVTAIEEASRDVEVLAPQYYRSADHSADGCFFFPEPVRGEPVRFPGQCSNVSVVENFNLTAFAGIWNEIQAYPKRQQQGQCVNHEYSAGAANTLNLQSFNVINRTLGVTDGVMSFDSNDNSARMRININSDGSQVTIPFWIIDTDYTDYALAYSCENDGEDFKYVYSWKLSRTKQLSPTANVSINNAMADIDVLDEQSFEDIDQSDEACFFLPEVAPGEEVVFPGQCDSNIPVVQNFRAADYTGRWFLIESYPSRHQSGTCNDATYTAGTNNVVNVLNTQVVNQTLATISGTATAYNDGTGRLLVTFGSSTPSEYWILDTDYSSYALVYSCRNINSDQRAVWSWKLSRTRSLTENATNAINQVIDSVNVLDSRYYYQIDRSEEACFYFPEPDLSRPVRFRGRCQNVTTVQNFNATRYLGVWHNIELYPTPFQGGACNNALYTLGDDGVVVFNTQVINQTLATITGLAVPVPSEDGNAILEVFFPTTNGSTPYWVLDTDYDSYALVYSCVEIDEEYKNVWSWKLSRTRQLQAPAVTAIANVINRVQVLDERYYRTADQSPEACFYYPEPQPGQVVRFPGRCNPNIPVEQNFNLTMFEGIWHEIQTYPKEQQQGQCISHTYSLGTGNTLDLISASVSNITRALTNGTLRFASPTDNSGKLTITITSSDGQEVTIPFWILDTDYLDYALAYACVDEVPENDMDYRRVFSWKLSRTRSLSPAANESIDSVIDSIDVLHNQYYEDVDQSDDACFFLPDFVAGEPVIFPGQCDPNVPVVQNFNASAYLGRWRTIELYHADFNTGECSEANYSPNANGNVDVLNTHVINEALFSASGTAVPAADGSGRLTVTFSNSANPSIYWVLATDYDNYALVYTCRNINSEQRRVGSWLLSRDRTLSPDARASINQVIDRVNVLDNRYYVNMPQSDDACFYYPVADGSPVIFRGQCDNNITVVRDFNVTRYLGTWYDIESYPAGFQSGTCNTQQLDVNGGVVEVVNSQVVDQELDTIKATAVPAVDDGSAKLTVTFPAGPNATVDVPYWVLDTDYESYSLVYSCQNVDAERRRVTSWKLSRDRFLSAPSNNAINAVMNTVPVLRQQYYLQRNHSDDSCFYYPDNFGGPIVFNDGQCPTADQVNAVTNFDADRFAGEWHEVERFPSELQTGACASSQFSIGANGSSTLTQTIVYNERQQTVSGSAVVASGGRGVIAVNINDAGVVVNNNLYVIDTDYSEFALMYACRTLSSTSRQVYSWKLSRTRDGLSAAAVNRINEVVREEVDLHRSYYEKTAQDNDACFYYPEWDPLPDSIQLPGPCPNVPAVANFNISAYVGRWHEIERYPQTNQRAGRCNRARYTEPTSTSFNVLNYQVQDGPILRTISGNATVASTDGSGKLLVTLQNGQRVQTLSVLDTDYENYALLYNCRDLANGWRQVASWKFSRTTTLSPASENAIEAVINRTQGLNQDYYFLTNQTEEACFFVPAFEANQRPRFRASCDSISGMQQFDMNRYQGWWHEFESYATEENRGDCVSARYSVSGTTVQYVGTGVFGLNSQVITGTVVVGPNGKLTKTLSNGNVEELWVVDTDYDTYSVVISCEAVDDEFVSIWSAKYRKTYNGTQAITDATNAVVAGHPLLYQDLYRPVDQSDEACFHYPAATGDRVILRGQCDQNIPVQNDFSLSSYTGTWYQIERYPYPEVRADSTCIGTRYTLSSGSDVVTVVNWEVVGGEFRTIEGLGTVVGNARLQVQIPNPDANQTATTDLYILNTDYSSYSLAYTCENLNDFERAVVAFKLSRSRELREEAAINATILSRPELDDRYFIRVTHEDCVDPSSSFLVKSSFLVVLLCYALHMLM